MRQANSLLEDGAEVMGDAQLQEQLAGQPPDVQEEILRINDEARPQALQIALLVPLLACVLGLFLSIRMMRLPDPADPWKRALEWDFRRCVPDRRRRGGRRSPAGRR